MTLHHQRLCAQSLNKKQTLEQDRAAVPDALKGCPSLSFQKSRLNDTTWGCQVVIAIETSIGHRCENFEWPQQGIWRQKDILG